MEAEQQAAAHISSLLRAPACRYWVVAMAGLQVAGGPLGAGVQFPSSAKQVILDSGTSAILVSKTDADSIHKARLGPPQPLPGPPSRSRMHALPQAGHSADTWA